MQGGVIHAKKNDEVAGPHLTQQSAQVDHWALCGKTKLMKEYVALKEYFTFFSPLQYIYVFLRNIIIKHALINVS